MAWLPILPTLACVAPRRIACVGVSRACARGIVSSAASPKKMVFLGTPSVAARSLELILEASREGRGGGFELAAVVSQPPTRSGRKMKLTPSPVHLLAEREGLPLFTPPDAKDDEFLSALESIRPDVCVTAAYGCFLPQRFLDIPQKGTLNIHPSLLPLYRGAAPLQRSLENDDEYGGVTVLFTALKMDAGPVLRQRRRAMRSSEEQAPELLLSLFEEGSHLLVDALPSVWDGSCAADLVPQDEAAATKAAKVTKEEAELRLDQMGARAAHARVRAFAGWPGTWVYLSIGGEPAVRAKIGLTRAAADATPAPPTRAISRDGDALQFTCADGSVLEVLRITMPGRKPVDATAFWNGLNGREACWCAGPTESDA